MLKKQQTGLASPKKRCNNNKMNKCSDNDRCKYRLQTVMDATKGNSILYSEIRTTETSINFQVAPKSGVSLM